MSAPEEPVKQAIRRIQRHITKFQERSAEIQSLLSHLSDKEWVTESHKKSMQRIKVLLYRKRLHTQWYSKTLQALASKLERQSKGPHVVTVDMLLNLLRQLQLNLDRTKFVIEEQIEKADPRARAQLLLDRLKVETVEAEGMERMFAEYLNSYFEPKGGKNEFAQASYQAAVRSCGGVENYATAATLMLALLGSALGAYTNAEAGEKPAQVQKKEEKVSLYFKGYQAHFFKDKAWQVISVNLTTPLEILQTSPDKKFYLISCKYGKGYVLASEVDVVPTSTVRFLTPDRVNHTSGFHIGGKRAGSAIKKIIIHITSSEGNSAEHWFHDKAVSKEKAVSAHYINDRDGNVVEIVPLDTVAFHCSGQNQDSIGIENVGLENTKFTIPQLRKLIALIRKLQSDYKIPVSQVLPHFQLNKTGKTCPGKENWEIINYELTHPL